VRALRATRIAAEAETLRLRLQVRRLAVCASLGAVAGTFLVSALVLAHVAVWSCLRLRYDWMVDSTAVVMTAGDLAIAGALVLVASRVGPGAAEIEARLVRQQAWRAVTETLIWPTLLLRLLRLLRDR